MSARSSVRDDAVDMANGEVFNDAERQYARAASSGLTSQELRCLQAIPDAQRGSVLDIGVGAGRTTGPLAALFRYYEGIDYADKLVAIAKRNYPDQNLRVMDARKLDVHETYDCIFFSFNGLDCISYQDRTRFLEASYRALKPGGYLIYSTHNLAHSRTATYMANFFVREQLPFILRPWRLFEMLSNRKRLFARQWRSPDGRFCIVNDVGLRFGLLMVYVDIPAELGLLHSYGFEVPLTIGCRKMSSGYDSADAWVYVMAQKKATAGSRGVE